MASSATPDRSSITKAPLSLQNPNKRIGQMDYDANEKFQWYGAQSPPGAATVAAAGTGIGNLTAGVRYYRITLVTASGETEGGTISSALTTTATDSKALLSSIPTGSPGIVTARNIYRTRNNQPTEDSNFLLVAQIADNSTTTYDDNIPDYSLGVACPIANTTLDSIMSLTKAGILSVNGLGDSSVTAGEVVFGDTDGGFIGSSDLTWSESTSKLAIIGSLDVLPSASDYTAYSENIIRAATTASADLGSDIGLAIDFEVTPAASHTMSYSAIQSIIKFAGTHNANYVAGHVAFSECDASAGTLGAMYGIDIFNYDAATGTHSITKLSGIRSFNEVDGPGSAVKVVGVEAINAIYGGTTTNLIGVEIDSASPMLGGTVTNRYGLKIGDVASAATINDSINVGLGEVRLGGGLTVATRNLSSANGTQGVNDQVLFFTTAASDRTLTMLSAATYPGKMLRVAKVDSGAGKVTISDANGAAFDITAQWGSVVLVSNGTTWVIF